MGVVFSLLTVWDVGTERKLFRPAQQALKPTEQSFGSKYVYLIIIIDTTA